MRNEYAQDKKYKMEEKKMYLSHKLFMFFVLPFRLTLSMGLDIEIRRAHKRRSPDAGIW